MYLEETEITAIAQLPNLNIKDENYTPPEELERVKKVLGTIHLDPCSNAFANRNVGAQNIITQEQDALTADWIEAAGRRYPNGFMNPPYSRGLVGAFTDRFLHYWNEGMLGNWCLLYNSNTDTRWFHSLAEQATCTLLYQGRLGFYCPFRSEPGKRESNRVGQVMFYFGMHPNRFHEEFKTRGLIYGRGE